MSSSGRRDGADRRARGSRARRAGTSDAPTGQDDGPSSSTAATIASEDAGNNAGVQNGFDVAFDHAASLHGDFAASQPEDLLAWVGSHFMMSTDHHDRHNRHDDHHDDHHDANAPYVYQTEIMELATPEELAGFFDLFRWNKAMGLDPGDGFPNGNIPIEWLQLFESWQAQLDAASSRGNAH